MTHMDGMETAQRIREPGSSVILLFGAGYAAKTTACAVFVDYIFKYGIFILSKFFSQSVRTGSLQELHNQREVSRKNINQQRK